MNTTHHGKRGSLWGLACLAAALAAPLTSRADTVVVGQVAPLTGLRANDGRGYAAGLKMYFAHVNKAGGINGHTLTLVQKDDRGRPDQTVELSRQLLTESRPHLLSGYIGKDSLAQLQQASVLVDESISLVGYRSGSWAPGSRLLFSVSADPATQIDKIAGHLATVSINKLGVFYEKGPDAEALLSQIGQVLQKQHATLVGTASHLPDTIEVTAAAEQLVAAQPQAILLLTNGAASAAFIETYRLAGGKARIFATSETDLEQLTKRLSSEHMRGVSIAQVVPNPYRVHNRLSKEFLDIYAQNGDKAVPVSFVMMEGFIAGKVIAEAVRRSGSKITRAGLTTALAGIDEVDIGGYRVGFAGGKRSGSRYVDLSVISDTERIRQ